MALKAPIEAGASYSVRYASDLTSRGASLLIVGWVPKHGNQVPGPQEKAIAPGKAGEISGTVPAFDDAVRIEIRVDLPDGTGSGTLELKQNGQAHSSGSIATDITWTSLVDK